MQFGIVMNDHSGLAAVVVAGAVVLGQVGNDGTFEVLGIDVLVVGVGRVCVQRTPNLTLPGTLTGTASSCLLNVTCRVP